MMPRCEDYPCCGHAPNDCPEFDSSSGFMPYRCIECGDPIPVAEASRNHASFCKKCLENPSTFCDEGCTGCINCAPI